MAITSSPVSTTVTTTERTWRATIETPFNATPPGDQDYSLTIHREKRVADGNGAQVGDVVVLDPFVFRFADIATQSFTVNGVTLTVAQLSAFLQTAFDQLATAVEHA